VKRASAEAKGDAAEEHIWLIYRGQTYRVPMSFVHRHPKGRALILPYANQDMTAAYDDAGHSKDAMRLLRKFASGAMCVQEVERVHAAQREARDQAAWNWRVRSGILLSVATVLGAAYVRYCRRERSS
jgi:cytochrome b involved in lipid metabolism